VNFPKRATSLLSLAGSRSTGPQSGQVNRELKMNAHLDAAAVGESKVPKFRVDLQNAGEDDLILNLGITLANGRKQYPKDIVLLLTDSPGKARRFELKEPFYVAGRVDSFDCTASGWFHLLHTCGLGKILGGGVKGIRIQIEARHVFP
jgi:hypothetical protein